MRLLKDVSADLDRVRKRVEALEAAQPNRRWKNRRAVFNFTFSPVADPPAGTAGVGTQFPYQEQSVTVDQRAIFHVTSMDVVYSVTGTFDDGTSASVVIPAARRRAMFDFSYKFRDTGTDREWQNEWLPGALLCTGNSNPLQCAVSRAVVPGGGEIICAVDARFFNTQDTLGTSSFPGVSEVTEHSLKISLMGWEVLT